MWGRVAFRGDWMAGPASWKSGGHSNPKNSGADLRDPLLAAVNGELHTFLTVVCAAAHRRRKRRKRITGKEETEKERDREREKTEGGVLELG